MSSFRRSLRRLAQEQDMANRMSKYDLGREVSIEKGDIDEGRSQYTSDYHAWQNAQAKAQARKSKRNLWGTLLGIGLNFVPGIGPMAKVAGNPILTALAKAAPGMIGGALGGYSSSRVDMPGFQSNVNVPEGRFHSQARKDLSRDILDTIQFVDTANEGQSLLDWTNALGSMQTASQFGGLFGDDESIFSGYGDDTSGVSDPTSFRSRPGYQHQPGRPS